MPKIGEFLFGGGGTEGKMHQMPMFDPQQMEFMKRILSQIQPGMGSGIDYLTQMLSGEEGAFDAFEAPYKRQFEEQTIPALAERFASMDAQGSSAFGQSLSAAGAGLTENLAMLREGLKGQAMSQLGGLSQMGLQRMFENVYEPGEEGGSGLFGGLMSGLSGGFGKAAGSSMYSKLFK